MKKYQEDRRRALTRCGDNATPAPSPEGDFRPHPCSIPISFPAFPFPSAKFELNHTEAFRVVPDGLAYEPTRREHHQSNPFCRFVKLFPLGLLIWVQNEQYN